MGKKSSEFFSIM